jgi:serine/threonine protein kinase
MHHAVSRPGDVVGGRYRLIELAGAGGMAEVWRAELEGIEGFRRTVAVKRILKHLSVSKEHREMFVQEAKLTATLDHPNIVHVYDFGEDSAGLFLVLEWVEGLTARDLIQLLNEYGQKPSAALATAIGIEVLKALEAAHENTITMPDGSESNAPIIHRDISPSNVLLSVRGVTKLADFGLARAMHSTISSMTPAGIVKGKLAYMAPEILRGKPAGAQSDVYSTGVLLWELLSCKRLFQGEGEVIQALMQNKRPSSIAAHRPDLPPALSAAVDRALDPDTEVRFKSAGEFARALSDVLRTVPERTDRARLAKEMRNALVYWRKSAAGQKALAERQIAPQTESRPEPIQLTAKKPAEHKAEPAPEPSKVFLDLSLSDIPLAGRETKPPHPSAKIVEKPVEEMSASSIELDLETAVPLVETVPVEFDASDASVTFELAALKKK